MTSCGVQVCNYMKINKQINKTNKQITEECRCADTLVNARKNKQTSEQRSVTMKKDDGSDDTLALDTC